MTLPLLKSLPITTPRRWMLTSAALAVLSLSGGFVQAEEKTLPPLSAPIDLPTPGEGKTLPPVEEMNEQNDEDAAPVDTHAGDQAHENAPTTPPLVTTEIQTPDHTPTVPTLTKSFSEEHQAVVQEVLLKANAQVPDNNPSNLQNAQAADLVYRVNTEPPTRQRLFRLLSQEGYLSQLEKDYRAAGQTGSFYLPAPIDNFNAPNSNVLPPTWFQSSATGQLDQTELDQRRGWIHIYNNMARQNVGAPPEVAIINESVGSSDMAVMLEINLEGPDNTFGVVLRAKDPREWVEAVDQIKVNTYFYALFGRDSVALYYHEPGKEDLLIKSAEIPAKQSFHVMATVYSDQFRVYRDGQEVLSAVDTTMPTGKAGDFCGMIAGITEGAPTLVDNFLGRRYGGEYATREWAPTAAVFRGANVHYHPLYFEQIALERYGQHFGNLFAPWVAHALFFADAALLPYSIGKSPPWTCQNDVCLYKPGDIVPFRLYLPIPDKKGIFLQATAMALCWSVIP